MNALTTTNYKRIYCSYHFKFLFQPVLMTIDGKVDCKYGHLHLILSEL